MDAWARLLDDERESWRLLLGEAKREGEFIMAIGYQPRNSNYHDHLCDCPGCNYDGPEPTDEEVLEMAWRDLQSLPSYVETQARAWAAELNLEVQA